MRAYSAIISARFRMLLQYRAAAIAGFGTQLFFGLVMVMIYEAFYRSTTAPQPLELSQVITYVWLSQAFFTLMPFRVDGEIRLLIRQGNVAYELLKPVDLYNLWYSRAVANRTAIPLLRSIPLFVVAMLWLGMQPPDSVASGFAWALAMVGAVALACAISVILMIALLWTISGEGFMRILPALVLVFSGNILPLPLFPDWAQTALHLLPFAGLIDFPNRLYVGNIPPEHVVYVLAHQRIWTAILVAFGRWLLQRGTTIMVVQGG
jgi:ABC-2 type transport system permease protein